VSLPGTARVPADNVCVTALAEAAFPSGPPSLPSAGFEVGYVAEGGASRSVALAEAQALPFEHFLPVRRFAARKGQRHLSGLRWSATTGGHVGFESWLERDHLMLLDFDPQVTGISSQPFWLRWLDEGGKAVAHVPDFFARRADGSAVVVDCRPAERRKPAPADTAHPARPRPARTASSGTSAAPCGSSSTAAAAASSCTTATSGPSSSANGQPQWTASWRPSGPARRPCISAARHATQPHGGRTQNQSTRTRAPSG
jgi:hypothetical protein